MIIFLMAAIERMSLVNHIRCRKVIGFLVHSSAWAIHPLSDSLDDMCKIGSALLRHSTAKQCDVAYTMAPHRHIISCALLDSGALISATHSSIEATSGCCHLHSVVSLNRQYLLNTPL